MVAEGGDPSCAAICSAGCADVYGLEVLASAIQNNSNNRTRFYVLSCEEALTNEAGRLAFIAAGSASELPDLLESIDSAGATLITIHDRPLKTELGEYNYVIECEGLTYEEYCQIASDSTLEFRYLGSFNSVSN
jgi:prephenate dehydratase